MHERSSSTSPTILTLAGMEQPGPSHWLSRWETDRPCTSRVHLGIWDRPHRNSWVTAISHAVSHVDGPVILVARGLACIAVAWWAALERPAYGSPVSGALLVAPPNVDSAGADLRLMSFGPAPKTLLPFPSAVVASRNDPRMDFGGALALARFWGSYCFDGGAIGSANAAADLGEWSNGAEMLDWVIEEALPSSGASKFRSPALVPLSASHRHDYAKDISL
ncbi:MAG: alpha/beta hydrolase [Sphingobium sp.]|uniref:RBBP9/YdeN family alpha/beta hydrolase n=1 Tax=Sphingobium sp. TaxID=1912891 RepID=UPI0029A7A5E9|nr:alpha/beta hydrolase [Sphingobium sp.]MDX3908443.1 alpha/beta hydrolase [Sphingobium sp.]